MTTLNELKAEYLERCWTCGGYTEASDCVSCRVHPLISALTAAKLEDEATIAERTRDLECGFMDGAYARLKNLQDAERRVEMFATLDKAWAQGMESENDSLRAQLSATKEELRKAYEALKLIESWRGDCVDAEDSIGSPNPKEIAAEFRQSQRADDAAKEE